MKKLMIALTAALAAATLVAATRSKNVKAMEGGDDAPTTVGKAAKVLIDQTPRTGQSTLMIAPSLAGGTQIGQCYKKPRQWAVIETKYTTYGSDTPKSRFLPQLTFTWHVLLDTKSAKENKGNPENLTPYSYFSTSITYFNIPRGTHASCVVLPPSYIEHYGEPKAVGYTITNENGDELGGCCQSEITGIKSDTKWWDDDTVMNAVGKDGKPMIERRQGLLDRSKTIWALVNPNDYETTLQ